MKLLKRNKGITLIALVVSIAVLLILAGVAVSMVAGDNGILRRTVEAKERSKNANEEEMVKLSAQSALIDGSGTITKESLIKNLKSNNINLGEDDKNLIEITSNITTYYFYRNDSGVTYKITKDGNVANQISYRPTKVRGINVTSDGIYLCVKGEWIQISQDIRSSFENLMYQYALNDEQLAPYADQITIYQESDLSYGVYIGSNKIGEAVLYKINIDQKFYIITDYYGELKNEDDFIDADKIYWKEIENNVDYFRTWTI